VAPGWDDEVAVLPDTTSDEDDIGWGDDRGDADDRRLLEERPPHWA
jgi:hypothetical protein